MMCAADRNYGAYAGLVLKSAAAVTKKSKIHFHLLSDNIDPDDIAKCRLVAEDSGNIFSHYEVSAKLTNLPKILRMANHISRAAYSRLLFSDLLPQTVESVLYLDCDVVCQKDLTELAELAPTVDILGAVRDPWLDPDPALKISLGLNKDDVYFNSGVLLINVKTWRAETTEADLCAFIAARPDIKHADQDTLNAILAPRLTELPEKWNTMIDHPRRKEEPILRDDAAILHYVGGFKPWHFGYTLKHPQKGRPYASVKRSSPWKSKLPDFQFRRIRKKLQSLVRV